ncbi:hypothetical protein GQR58_002523 [Nymphon striatum]|nr:hypothetical protein GQR58_002523 [Nymphon striatum]
MGLQETFLLQSILKRKASFFGHLARGSAGKGLKMIVAEGWRKVGRGRRKRRWVDDVELVTGTKDVRKNIEMAEYKERWRENTSTNRKAMYMKFYARSSPFCSCQPTTSSHCLLPIFQRYVD